MTRRPFQAGILHQPTPVVFPCGVFQPLGDKGQIHNIKIGDDGAVWVTASSDIEIGKDQVARRIAEINGVARFDPQSGKWAVFGESEGLPAGAVHFVTPDRNGTAWLAFWGDLAVRPRRNVPVYYFDGKQWGPFAGSQDFQAENVNAVSIAPDQSVWFAADNGVYRWDRKADVWTHYTQADGLHDNSVSDILFTPDSKVWFVSMSGVSYLDQANLAGGSKAWWSRSDQRHTDRYDVATTSKDGRVWFSGQRYFDTSSQSWGDAVYRGSANDIAVDSRGGLWVAAGEAIYIPHPYNGPQKEWKTYSTEVGLRGKSIRTIAIGSDGAVWFGAENGTVSRCSLQQ